MLWDLRESARYSSFANGIALPTTRRSTTDSADLLKPCLVIQNAHTARYAPKISNHQSKTSLTSLLSLPPSGNPYPLLSGAADGLVKLWDVRLAGGSSVKKMYERKKYPDCVASGEVGRSMREGSRRCYGIIDLVGGGGRVHALTMNSKIVTFSPHTLQTISHRSHPSLQTSQFYFRLSLSPSSRHLASGSSNGKHVLFDLESHPSSQPIVFSGHEEGRDVGYVDWGGEETIASVGDDEVVRIWRADPWVVKGEKREGFSYAEEEEEML
ncbi:hypothetical protein BT69DRAFT_1279852 [Atractiella rhizophila]|nr:hypothetical protein BT69DRAFT_1279852 [Atractiella rhizophila]